MITGICLFSWLAVKVGLLPSFSYIESLIFFQRLTLVSVRKTWTSPFRQKRGSSSSSWSASAPTLEVVNMPITKNCLWCNQEFKRSPSHAKGAKFCSNSCRAKYTIHILKIHPSSNEDVRQKISETKRRGRIKTCLWCGQEYWCKPSRIKESKFCSRHCMGKYRLLVLKENPSFNPEAREKIRKAMVGRKISAEAKERRRQHDLQVLDEAHKLSANGFHCIPLTRGLPHPDIIAIDFKGKKIYAVEVEDKITPGRMSVYTNVKFYDDIIWIKRRDKNE